MFQRTKATFVVLGSMPTIQVRQSARVIGELGLTKVQANAIRMVSARAKANAAMQQKPLRNRALQHGFQNVTHIYTFPGAPEKTT
ncbi:MULTISPECIES: hypothetical protein [unclassified Marinovum]